MLCAGELFQKYVYGAVPKLALTVALPVALPKQSTSVLALSDALNDPAGAVMIASTVVVQPLASVIVHVQVPALKLVAVAFACAGVVFQLYV